MSYIIQSEEDPQLYLVVDDVDNPTKAFWLRCEPDELAAVMERLHLEPAAA